MRKRQRKILLFEKLDGPNSIIARGFRLLGFKVYYLTLSPRIKQRMTLKGPFPGIEGLSYENLGNASLYDQRRHIAKLAETTFATAVEPSRLYACIRKYFSIQGPDITKCDIAFVSFLQAELKPFYELLYFAQKLGDARQARVYVFVPNTIWTRTAIKNLEGHYRNLCPRMITATASAVGMLVKLIALPILRV